jgi:hypothetical protein
LTPAQGYGTIDGVEVSNKVYLFEYALKIKETGRIFLMGKLARRGLAVLLATTLLCGVAVPASAWNASSPTTEHIQTLKAAEYIYDLIIWGGNRPSGTVVVSEELDRLSQYTTEVVSSASQYDKAMSDNAGTAKLIDGMIYASSLATDAAFIVGAFATGDIIGGVVSAVSAVANRIFDIVSIFTGTPKTKVLDFLWSEAKHGWSLINTSELTTAAINFDYSHNDDYEVAKEFVQAYQNIQLGLAALRMGRDVFSDEVTRDRYDEMVISNFNSITSNLIGEIEYFGTIYEMASSGTELANATIEYSEAWSDYYASLADEIDNRHFSAYVDEIDSINKETQAYLTVLNPNHAYEDMRMSCAHSFHYASWRSTSMYTTDSFQGGLSTELMTYLYPGAECGASGWQYESCRFCLGKRLRVASFSSHNYTSYYSTEPTGEKYLFCLNCGRKRYLTAQELATGNYGDIPPRTVTLYANDGTGRYATITKNYTKTGYSYRIMDSRGYKKEDWRGQLTELGGSYTNNFSYNGIACDAFAFLFSTDGVRLLQVWNTNLIMSDEFHGGLSYNIVDGLHPTANTSYYLSKGHFDAFYRNPNYSRCWLGLASMPNSQSPDIYSRYVDNFPYDLNFEDLPGAMYVVWDSFNSFSYQYDNIAHITSLQTKETLFGTIYSDRVYVTTWDKAKEAPAITLGAATFSAGTNQGSFSLSKAGKSDNLRLVGFSDSPASSNISHLVGEKVTAQSGNYRKYNCVWAEGYFDFVVSPNNTMIGRSTRKTISLDGVSVFDIASVSAVFQDGETQKTVNSWNSHNGEIELYVYPDNYSVARMTSVSAIYTVTLKDGRSLQRWGEVDLLPGAPAPERGIFGTNAKWYGEWWHYLLFFLCFGFIWMWF